MPIGSRNSVISVLNSSLADESLSNNLSKRGRKRNFEDYSEEAIFLCNLFEKTDLSDTSVTAIINLRRSATDGPDIKTISRSSVRSFRTKSEVLHTSARDEENMGSTDVNSTWCTARVALYTQFQEQLRIGKLPPDHPDVVNSPFTPKHLHGILWCDQKHVKQKLGRGSKRQIRVSRDINGNMSSLQQGGAFKKKKGSKTVKFPLEGRGFYSNYCNIIIYLLLKSLLFIITQFYR